jgi:hypothetical protein
LRHGRKSQIPACANTDNTGRTDAQHNRSCPHFEATALASIRSFDSDGVMIGGGSADAFPQRTTALASLAGRG